MQLASNVQDNIATTDFLQAQQQYMNDNKTKLMNFTDTPNDTLSLWQQVIHKAFYSTAFPKWGSDIKDGIYRDMDYTIHMMFNTENCVWQRSVHSYYVHSGPELNCPQSMQFLGSSNFNFHTADDASRLVEYQNIMSA